MGVRPGLASNEMFIDLFAGGGGASTGAEAAIRRPVDVAVNHDEAAIAMHRQNHPETRHYREDVFAVDPREACGSRRVGALWLSPDCTHFSKAKGKQPRKKDIRALANVGIRWAETVRPRMIFLENVEEFADWGPLDEHGFPIKSRRGEDFRAWCGRLSDLGYKLDWGTLVAADYGAPTTRKRLFLQARCDGGPIVWPEPTHGKGRARPWRAAAEIIDWSLPCPSIFGRKRPLAEATLRRIARGIQRFVIGSARPFIVPVTHQGGDRVHGIDEPLRTVTAAHRGELSLVTPFIVRHGHYSTITGAGLEEGCGAGTFRGQRATDPLATVCATNDKHLVVPFITKHFGGGENGKPPPGLDARSPLDTITEQDHHALSAAFLTKFYGTSTGSSAQEPMPTVTATGCHLAEVRAFLMTYHGGDRGDSRGQLLFEPMRTVDTANRFALVMVHGEPYEIVDIGMRMLSPRELFNAQGFPEDYDITPELHGKPITKTQQIALAGNSVPPHVAEHVVAAAVFQGNAKPGARRSRAVEVMT